MTLILTLFATSNKQKELVEIFASELSSVSDENGVKYYFGDQSMIFKFETNLDFHDVKLFIEDMIIGFNICHLLTIYREDTSSFGAPPEIMKFLFPENEKIYQTEPVNNQTDNIEDLNYELDNSINNLVQELSDFYQNELKKEPKPTLNQLLDKISQFGMSNLTKKELNLLNQYSKDL